MAIRRKYEDVPQSGFSNTFRAKYSLKTVAGLKEAGLTTFVVFLDMANGYLSLPYHNVKPNGESGFKGGKYATKIACHAYNPETGEKLAVEPLCCKLARMERERLPKDADKRCLTSSSFRNVIPVMVLSSCESEKGKKPTLKKVSLKGVQFAYIDMADMTYREDFIKSIQDDLATNPEIDVEDLNEEELQEEITKLLKHSVVMVSTTSTSKAVKYETSYKVVPVSNEAVGYTSGEHKDIMLMSKLLSNEIPAEKLNAAYEKYPILKEINNQVTDFLSMFYAEVDSLVEEYSDEELQAFYDAFTDAQSTVDQYKDVNTAAQTNVQEQTVSFTKKSAPASVVDEDDDLDEFTAPSTSKASASDLTEDNFDYSDLDETASSSSSVLDDLNLEDNDFEVGEEDEFFEEMGV